MHDKDLLRLFPLHLQPVLQAVFIGVAGHIPEGADLCLYRYLFAEQLDGGKPVQQQPPHRPLALVSHKDHRAFGAPQVVLQVVPDAPGLTHTAGGNNDLGGRVAVQRNRFIHRAGKPQAGEADGPKALFQELQRLLIGIAGQVAVVDLGGLQRQRAIHVNAEIGVRFHQSPHLDLPKIVEQLLRAPHRKGRNDDIAAPCQRPVYDLGKIPRHILAAFMQAVAVGGFHHHIVGGRHRLRVPYNGLVHIADIPGKDDGAGLLLGHGKAYHRRPQQVAGVIPVRLHPGEQLGAVAVAYRHQQLQRIGGILYGIQRLHGRVAAALILSRLPLGVRLLDPRAVHQHDLQKVAGRPRGIDRPLVAVFHQQRQPPAVVGVGVGHTYRIDRRRIKEQLVFVIHIAALLQAAVDEDVFAAGGQTVAAAGHDPCRSPKTQFHKMPVPLSVILHLI